MIEHLFLKTITTWSRKKHSLKIKQIVKCFGLPRCFFVLNHVNTLEVQPPCFMAWFPNHLYFCRGLSSSKRNHHLFKWWQRFPWFHAILYRRFREKRIPEVIFFRAAWFHFKSLCLIKYWGNFDSLCRILCHQNKNQTSHGWGKKHARRCGAEIPGWTPAVVQLVPDRKT